MKLLVSICALAGLAAVSAAGCSAGDLESAMASGSGGFGLSGQTSSGPGAGGSSSVATGSGGPEALTYTEYCGNLHECTPGEGVASPECGAAGGAGGAGGAGAETDCHLVTLDGMEVYGSCTLPGPAMANDPCLSTADCGPGLGCVEDESGGTKSCLPYCCGPLENCPAQTFCAVRPMSANDLPNGGAGGGGTAPPIPVCVPVQDCTLLDDSTCSDGKTCTIVRVDGTVSCVQPGEGELGDACPCAAGYVCSVGTNSCLKLCHTATPGDDCPLEAPKCQGGASIFPQGYGVCVES